MIEPFTKFSSTDRDPYVIKPGVLRGGPRNPRSRAHGGFGAGRAVPAAKAERPLSVQSRDLRGDVGQRARLRQFRTFDPPGRDDAVAREYQPCSSREYLNYWIVRILIPRRSLGAAPPDSNGSRCSAPHIGSTFEVIAFSVLAIWKLREARMKWIGLVLSTSCGAGRGERLHVPRIRAGCWRGCADLRDQNFRRIPRLGIYRREAAPNTGHDRPVARSTR